MAAQAAGLNPRRAQIKYLVMAGVTCYVKLTIKEEWPMPTTGERPGEGTYVCANCGQAVVLDEKDDTLPPCPTCDGISFS